MDDIGEMKERTCCPRCGGSGESHQCGSARESPDNEGSEKFNAPQEKIRKRAYEFYVAPGRVDGSDVDDWLQAERELRAASHCKVE